MTSKLALAFVVISIFAAVYQHATATPISLEGRPLKIDIDPKTRSWLSLRICQKGSDNCQKLLATAADDLADDGLEPITLNIEEDGDEIDDDEDLYDADEESKNSKEDAYDDDDDENESSDEDAYDDDDDENESSDEDAYDDDDDENESSDEDAHDDDDDLNYDNLSEDSSADLSDLTDLPIYQITPEQLEDILGE